jgi:hypothetical protein
VPFQPRSITDTLPVIGDSCLCQQGAAYDRPMVEISHLVVGVARGDDAPKVLEPYGVILQGTPGNRQLLGARIPPVSITFADLASGLLRQWVLGTHLEEWASLVLMADCFDFPAERSADEERLIELIWEASPGRVITAEEVEPVRVLLES